MLRFVTGSGLLFRRHFQTGSPNRVVVGPIISYKALIP